MAIKEYIGARYVPKFYDDGQGGAEWSSEVQYEPLTVVLYEGNSYTSRQYVPVGIQITDTRYWLETGNWNSQVEAYRQEVFTFSDRIDAATQAVETEVTNREAADATLGTRIDNEATARANADNALGTRIDNEATARANADNALGTRIDNEATARISGDLKASGLGVLNGNIVCIGDSYLRGSNDNGALQTSWGEYIAQYTGKTVHRQFLGGIGFGNTNQTTFATLLQQAADALSADFKNNTTCIIVGGGYNDAGSSAASVKSGIASFYNIAKTNFPNANITAVFMPWAVYPDTQYPNVRRQSLEKWESGFVGTNIRFISNAYMALAVGDYLYMIDSKHPNNEGQARLAEAILNNIMGGTTSYSRGHVSLGTGASMGIDNNMVIINKYNQNWVTPSTENVTIPSEAVTFDGNTVAATLTMSNPLFKPGEETSVHYAKFSVQGIMDMFIDGVRVYSVFTGYIRVKTNGDLELVPMVLNKERNNWATGTVNRFRIAMGEYMSNINNF